MTSNPGAIDSKLAEYVFVPISQVLRISRTVPVRALELCLSCIYVLLRTGWGSTLTPELSGQLLILFTFMAKPSAAESGVAASSEELQIAALKCTAELFTELSKTTKGKDQLTAISNIPALGESILVALDCLTDSSSNAIRLQAIAAISALVSRVDDKDALASFLPRITSSLTKVLTPSSTSRPSFRVLECALEVLSILLLRLLGDQAVKDLPTVSSGTSRDGDKTVRSVSWLQATASQIKIALANVLKQRNHDKSEVRLALLRLCTTIIQECRVSLVDCVGMVIETMVILAGYGVSHDPVEDDLRAMLSTDQALSDLLRESLRGWIISLPRLMQSKDDTGRRQVIHQISTTLRLFDEDQTLVDSLLADNLRDGISAVFKDSNNTATITETMAVPTFDQQLIPGALNSSSFTTLRFQLKGQDDMMNEFKLLLSELARSSSATTIIQDLIHSLDVGTQENRLATFWIAVNLLRDNMTFRPSLDVFLDLGGPDLQEELLDNLYAHSLTILNPRDTDLTLTWHFQALALEVIALQASRYKTEFRPELTETLYPILHCLGGSNTRLRNHAITCLNIVATACDYASASELVISNVDYIVNAVGLRLSYGDVSPQAPQVLLMMMRLCGPSLLPYLDDLVGSIFGALERYHGYPKLVELLFAVLKGMAEEGVKTPQLAITSSSEHPTESPPPPDILQQLKELERRVREQTADLEELPRGAFPQKPWKGISENDFEDPSAPENEDPHEEEPPKEEKIPPPAPLTFSLLLKISELTQHYLTSSSSSLRTSLLSLLHTTIPALAKHEDSFLPLINTLWPVLLPRLEDPEAYIVANTLDVITLMCEHVGGFMKSRIEAAWDVLKRLHHRTGRRTGARAHRLTQSKPLKTTRLADLSSIANTSRAAALENKSLANASIRNEMYVDTPTKMIWDALVRLLCTISRHVMISDEAFDDVLDMLDSVLARDDVKQALDARNADAVWLRLYRKSKVTSKAKDEQWNYPTELGGPVREVEGVAEEWGFVTL